MKNQYESSCDSVFLWIMDYGKCVVANKELNELSGIVEIRFHFFISTRGENLNEWFNYIPGTACYGRKHHEIKGAFSYAF